IAQDEFELLWIGADKGAPDRRDGPGQFTDLDGAFARLASQETAVGRQGKAQRRPPERVLAQKNSIWPAKNTNAHVRLAAQARGFESQGIAAALTIEHEVLGQHRPPVGQRRES